MKYNHPLSHILPKDRSRTDYLNRLAGEAGRRWPAMRIATLAYNRHYQPPTFALSNRIDVMLALMKAREQRELPSRGDGRHGD